MEMEEETYLNAMVSVSKVIHGFELLVNDADASFVGAIDNILNILGGFPHVLHSCVDSLGCLNGSLRMKLGYSLY